MTQTVTALYDTHDDAVAAMHALAEAGVPVSDISIISSNADNRHERTHHAADDAKKGAGLGAAVGGLGEGLEATVGGVGATVGGLAKGLETTVGGLGEGLGATVGGLGELLTGLVGTLTSAGVPERDANIYAEGVRRGGVIVCVVKSSNCLCHR